MIAAVNGHAIGAGLDLACMCDIRIASEKAKFAESFIKLGIIPGDGGAWLLPRIVGMSRAAELAFTGDMIDAQQALAWNLVSRVVPHDELMSSARELAGRIAQHASHGVRLTKRLMREAIHSRLDTVLELSAVFQAICAQDAGPQRGGQRVPREARAAVQLRHEPMDADVTREELHFRRIDMRGYRRSDGLFEVEGRVTDRKPHDFDAVPAAADRCRRASRFTTWACGSCSTTSCWCTRCETFTDASPYAHCPEGGRALQSLKGLRMTSGWSKEVRSRLGGRAAART